jgi:hypothetical protein
MLSSLSLSGVPQGVLDMTADFAPLLVGLVVLLGLSILGIAFAIGVHDTREARQQAQRPMEDVATLPKAA